MSFMDKVKAQAETALTKAQQGVAQGQTKLNEMQAAKSRDTLLRELGGAYYAQQRSGGSADAVLAALAAVDTDMATPSAAPASPTPPTTDSAPPPMPAPGTPAPPAQSFDLDDV